MIWKYFGTWSVLQELELKLIKKLSYKRRKHLGEQFLQLNLMLETIRWNFLPHEFHNEINKKSIIPHILNTSVYSITICHKIRSPLFTSWKTKIPSNEKLSLSYRAPYINCPQECICMTTQFWYNRLTRHKFTQHTSTAINAIQMTNIMWLLHNKNVTYGWQCPWIINKCNHSF